MRKEDKKEKRKGKPQVSSEGEGCLVLTQSSFTPSLNLSFSRSESVSMRCMFRSVDTERVTQGSADGT